MIVKILIFLNRLELARNKEKSKSDATAQFSELQLKFLISPDSLGFVKLE